MQITTFSSQKVCTLLCIKVVDGRGCCKMQDNINLIDQINQKNVKCKKLNLTIFQIVQVKSLIIQQRHQIHQTIWHFIFTNLHARHKRVPRKEKKKKIVCRAKTVVRKQRLTLFLKTVMRNSSETITKSKPLSMITILRNWSPQSLCLYRTDAVSRWKNKNTNEVVKMDIFGHARGEGTFFEISRQNIVSDVCRLSPIIQIGRAKFSLRRLFERVVYTGVSWTFFSWNPLNLM